MGRPTKTRQARQAALREELQSREYLRQIHRILGEDWQPENVSVNTAKMNGYFRLLTKTLPDAKESPLTLEIDPNQPIAAQAQAVASAAITGAITPTQADSLLSVLERVYNIRVATDLENRVLRLELEANEDSD